MMRSREELEKHIKSIASENLPSLDRIAEFSALTAILLLDLRDQNTEIISLLSRKKSPVMMKEVELSPKELEVLNNLEEE